MQSWETPEALRLAHLPALQRQGMRQAEHSRVDSLGEQGLAEGGCVASVPFRRRVLCHRPSHSVQSLSPDHPAKQSVCFEGIILFKEWWGCGPRGKDVRTSFTEHLLKKNTCLYKAWNRWLAFQWQWQGSLPGELMRTSCPPRDPPPCWGSTLGLIRGKHMNHGEWEAWCPASGVRILAWNPSRKELRGGGTDTRELAYSPLSLHLVLTIPWLLLFVGQSCLTLCDPMDCSTQGFPVFTIFWSSLKLMAFESVMPSNHLNLCCPLLLLPFPMSQLFAPGGKSIGFFFICNLSETPPGPGLPRWC